MRTKDKSLLDELIELQQRDPEEAKRWFAALSPEETSALALENFTRGEARRALALGEPVPRVQSIE